MLNKKVTLQTLVNRMNMNEKFLKEHPENKDLLEKKIVETKDLIIQCVLQNDGNTSLEQIVLK